MAGEQTVLIPNNPIYAVAEPVPTQEITSAGAITILAGGMVVINAGSGIAVTLTAPLRNGIKLFVVSKTAQAHTLDLATSGINGTSNDIGTFGSAIGDGVILVSLGDHWYDFANTNVTWA